MLCFILAGRIIEHELGADRKCSVRPAERSERSRNLPEYRQTLCVCHTARSVYPNAVVTFDLIGRWDGEAASCPSQQILTLTKQVSCLLVAADQKPGSSISCWEQTQLFDHLPAPANQKPAGMCAAHLELFSLFTRRHTQTQLTVQAAASLQEDNKLNTTMIHHHHHHIQ